jgi:hypothetical protein
MGKAIDVINEARSVVQQIMESEGEFTEEQEAWLQEHMKASDNAAEWLANLYRRSAAESEYIDKEIRRLMTEKKKANRTSSWARNSMRELLLVRQELGESTNIRGVAHLMRRSKLLYPDTPDAWPPKFLIEQPPRLDVQGIKKAFKDKELPAGFRWEESIAAVMK